MAATWAPTVADVAALVQGWSHAVTDDAIIPLIDQAVVEVVAEVDYFNPTAAVNAAADLADQVLLGDLARNAAALRAAYQWASGLGPEIDLEFTRSLHARFMDAMERLLRQAARLTGRRRAVGALRLVAYGEE